MSVLVGRRDRWRAGSGVLESEGLPLEEGPLWALESILRVIPLGLRVCSDTLEDLPSPKPNKSEKSVALSLPLLCVGVFLKALPADWERVIDSGRSIRRDFTSEVSLEGDEAFLFLFAVTTVRQGQGSVQYQPTVCFDWAGSSGGFTCTHRRRGYCSIAFCRNQRG